MSVEKKMFINAAVYGMLGLAAGLFWRTYTHHIGMQDSQHLSMLHTHILTLGFFFFLIVLAIEKLYKLSDFTKLFGTFYWLYTLGLAMTVSSMFAIGVIQANGNQEGASLVGISGLGHILLTLGLIIFIINLGKSLTSKSS
jgi:hypothetical protein